jgi:hypothetical protein
MSLIELWMSPHCTNLAKLAWPFSAWKCVGSMGQRLGNQLVLYHCILFQLISMGLTGVPPGQNNAFVFHRHLCVQWSIISKESLSVLLYCNLQHFMLRRNLLNGISICYCSFSVLDCFWLYWADNRAWSQDPWCCPCLIVKINSVQSSNPHMV